MIYVVIRGRNCAKYLRKCLTSLFEQTYTEWRAMIVLDAPEDNSVAVARKFCDEDRRLHMYVNETHKGLGQNMWFAIKWTYAILRLVPEDILAILDADDILHEKALGKVAKTYAKHPDCLITYGSYIKVSKGRKTRISREYPKDAKVRKYQWHASHLKTFKAKLVPYIEQDWFIHKEKWIPCASDVALMLPLMELVGLKRCRHISKGIYFWRDTAKDRKSREKQIKWEKIIRAKPCLRELTIA